MAVDVINEKKGDIMHSSLSYPVWIDTKEFEPVAVLDNSWVRTVMKVQFSCILGIANRCVIKMPNGVYWYQFETRTYLLNKLP